MSPVVEKMGRGGLLVCRGMVLSGKIGGHHRIGGCGGTGVVLGGEGGTVQGLPGFGKRVASGRSRDGPRVSLAMDLARPLVSPEATQVTSFAHCLVVQYQVGVGIWVVGVKELG